MEQNLRGTKHLDHGSTPKTHPVTSATLRHLPAGEMKVEKPDVTLP